MTDNKQIIAYTRASADLFHYGHLRLLKKAKRNDLINTKETAEMPLKEALLNRFVIHRAGKKFLTAVAG